MKLSRIAFIALVLPAGVAAQNPPAPPAAPPTDPITTVFRARTMALQRNLAQAFDSIPESKFGYKPTPVQQSIGFIAQHLATDNYLFCTRFGPMKANIAPADESTADSIKAKWPKDSLNAKLKASFKYCEDAFAQLNDANLSEQVELKFGNNPPRNVSRVSMVLGHVIDMADHYSQIANYMRLNNMIPPTALPRPRP